MFTPPAVPVQPAAPQPAQPYYMPPPARGGLPTWLLSILFALAFVGLGAGAYWAIRHFSGETRPSAAAPEIALESPSAKAPAKPSPYQKYVEVTGVRLSQNTKRQVEARFLIVNHSEGEMADLAGTVEIRGRTSKDSEEPVGSFDFKLPSIGPNESKEMKAIVDTKLKAYELPDWQNIDARVRITSP